MLKIPKIGNRGEIMGIGKKMLASLLSAMLFAGTVLPGAAVAFASVPENNNNKPLYAPDRVIVKFKKQTGMTIKNDIKTKLSLNTKKRLGLTDSEVLEIDKGKKVEDVINSLKADPNVEYVQPDYLYYPKAIIPDDTRFSELWGLNDPVNNVDIDAPEAWEISQGTSDVIVAVIDTGVDINHPDLAPNIWVNADEIPDNGLDDDNNGYVDDINGWDFYNHDNTVFDREDGDEHGTHVAGTIAAVFNNNAGVAGVAPGVKIMPLKFIGPLGVGSTSDAISAIEYAAANGAVITNNSWGGQGADDPLLRQAIDQANAVFVAAAGNEAVDNDVYLDIPSGLNSSKIIAVAAVNNLGSLAGFSNYGFNSVDVAAPGEGILSLKPYLPPVGAVVYASGTVAESTYKIIHAGFGLEHITDDVYRAELLGQLLSVLDTDTGTPILLVDDDSSETTMGLADYSVDYINALSGYTFTSVYAGNLSDGPTVAEMAYKTVIWFTGDASGDITIPTLTDNELANLRSFLNGGGRLLLVGDDLPYLREDDPLFTDYLQESITQDYRYGTIVDGINPYFGSYTLGGSLNLQDALTPKGPGATTIFNYRGEDPELAYQVMNGTSMAAPHVAGIAALLKSVKPSLTPEQVIDLIKQTVVPYPSLSGKIATGGVVNAFKALAATANPSIETVDGKNSPAFSSNSSPQAVVSGVTPGSTVKIIEGVTELVYGTAAGTSITLPLSNLSEGQHNLVAQVTDPLGNVKSSLGFTYTVDTTAPVITGKSPGDNAGGVAVGTNIEITYNEPVNPATVNGNSIYLLNQAQNSLVPAMVSYDSVNNKAVLNPDTNLSYTTQYAVYVTGAVYDRAGNSLTGAPVTWLFTTENPPSGGGGGGSGSPTPSDGTVIVYPGQPVTIRTNNPGVQASLEVTGGGSATVQPFSTTASQFTRVENMAGSFGADVEESFLVSFDGSSDVNSAAKVTIKVDGSVKDRWVYRYDPVYNTLVPLQTKVENGALRADVSFTTQLVIVKEGVREFNDVEGIWSEKYIEPLARRNILNGVSREMFAPRASLTREQLAKVIALAGNVRGTDKNSNFSDLTAGERWSKPFINSVKSAGIIDGYRDGSFQPEKPVTRAELVKMVVNAFGLKVDATQKGFTDSRGHWAENYIATAAKAGIIGGYSDGTFKPDTPVTREEAAKIIALASGI